MPAIAEMGVAVALAAVLGMVRVWTMPQGGSVSLEMLPILFVAIRRGLGPGVATGVVYGLLQLLLPGAFITTRCRHCSTTHWRSAPSGSPVWCR